MPGRAALRADLCHSPGLCCSHTALPTQSQLFLASMLLPRWGPVPRALVLSISQLHPASSWITSVSPLSLSSDRTCREPSLNIWLQPCSAPVTPHSSLSSCWPLWWGWSPECDLQERQTCFVCVFVALALARHLEHRHAR